MLLVANTLAPGAALPSVRRMALDLGVHFNTVAEAYRTLAEEGWLDLRHGRGATVIERRTPSPNLEQMQEFRQRLRSLVAHLRAEGVPTAILSAELQALAEELSS